MSEKIKISSNRSFGIVFSFIFLVIAIYPIFNGSPLRIWALVISFIFLILGLTDSKYLNFCNFIWFKLGLQLAKIFNPIILGLIFFVIVTPIAILMKILNKDLLSLKYNSNNSYWIDKPEIKSNMKDQF